MTVWLSVLRGNTVFLPVQYLSRTSINHFSFLQTTCVVRTARVNTPVLLLVLLAEGHEWNPDCFRLGDSIGKLACETRVRYVVPGNTSICSSSNGDPLLIDGETWRNQKCTFFYCNLPLRCICPLSNVSANLGFVSQITLLPFDLWFLCSKKTKSNSVRLM